MGKNEETNTMYKWRAQPDQSGVSNFTLGERKIKKNVIGFVKTAFSNVALYVIRKDMILFLYNKDDTPGPEGGNFVIK